MSINIDMFTDECEQCGKDISREPKMIVGDDYWTGTATLCSVICYTCTVTNMLYQASYPNGASSFIQFSNKEIGKKFPVDVEHMNTIASAIPASSIANYILDNYKEDERLAQICKADINKYKEYIRFLGTQDTFQKAWDMFLAKLYKIV